MTTNGNAKAKIRILGILLLTALSACTKKKASADQSTGPQQGADTQPPESRSPESPQATPTPPSNPTTTRLFPAGCYALESQGQSAVVLLQATGKGSYLIWDGKGELFSNDPKRPPVPNQAAEFTLTPGLFPQWEAKSSDGRFLTLSEGILAFSAKASAAPITAKVATGCVDPEGVIGSDVVPGESVIGIADLHAHPFANDGFGGKLFHGKSFSPFGAADALATCEVNHGRNGLGDIVGNAVDEQLGHDTTGFPSFRGWPSAYDSNHQQMYYRWMERAYLGGLRLLVAHAVNSEALCSLVRRQDKYSCDDMATVDRQLDRAYELQAYIDAQFGGEGLGWLRIVKSAAEARRVIQAGKLAMVLGIEVDALFGCRVGHCDEASVLKSLDLYRERGVRQLFPIHVTDNAFGGAAVYTPVAFNLANKLLNGSFFSIEDCAKEGFTYQETSIGESALVRALLAANEAPPTYPKMGAHCNTRALSDLGRVLMKGLMKRGMLIDVDHMSSQTLDDVLTLAETHQYPVVAGHTGFVTTSAAGQKRSEAQKNDLQLRRIIRLGGMVGPILHQGKAGTEILPFGPVANDCDSSSKAWAQAYSYALSIFREEKREPALAFGSDFNGMVHTTAPRFGERACDGNSDEAALQKNPVAYPFPSATGKGSFDRMRAGERIYDYNSDGFANIGLLPDFVEDLKAIGLSKDDLQPLLQSAEAYLRVWEKAEAAGAAIQP